MEQNSNGVDRDRLRDVQSWRRSRTDRVLAGVCGGMARALNVDPVLVRVVMAVLVVSGPGLLFYVAAWVLMPDEGADRSAAQAVLGNRVRPDHPWLWPVVIGACVFVAIAVMSSFDFGRLVPGPLVVLGLLWLFVFRKKGTTGSRWSHHGFHGMGGGRPEAPAAPTAPGAWGSTGPAETARSSAAPAGTGPDDPAPASPYASGSPSATSRYAGVQDTPPTGSSRPAGPSSSATPAPQDRTVEPVQPVWTEDDPLGLYVDEPPAPPAARAPAEPAVRGYRGVKPAVVALTGLALAIAYLAQAPTTTILAVGLATLGAGMLVGGFVGRTLGLLPLGILLALGVAASTVFPTVPRDLEDTNVVATAGQQITGTSSAYAFDAGAVRLDLTKATFAPGARIAVDGGVGEVVLKLPANLDVTGTLSAQTGEVVALGQRRGGHDAAVTLADLGADGTAGPESVVLDVKLKLGSIKVERG